MSQGIAKSAEVPEADRVPPEHITGKSSSISDYTLAVHPEFYKYFNVSPFSETSDNLKSIVNWAVKDTESIGTALSRINRLEIKLGTPSHGETRVGKLYNFITMSDRLDMKKQEMQGELDSIKTKHKNSIKEIDGMYEGKIDKINSELEKTLGEYKKARDTYNRTASETMAHKRKEYSRQIEELKKLKAVYNGRR